ncbi:MAG: superinfection immunity protein [Alphaproteobacteria bacterium]
MPPLLTDLLIQWLQGGGVLNLASLYMADWLLSNPWWTLSVLASYLSPTVIAVVRRHPNQASIGVVNFFLGFTYIGWVVALAWSLSYIPPEVRRTFGWFGAKE